MSLTSSMTSPIHSALRGSLTVRGTYLLECTFSGDWTCPFPTFQIWQTYALEMLQIHLREPAMTIPVNTASQESANSYLFLKQAWISPIVCGMSLLGIPDISRQHRQTTEYTKHTPSSYPPFFPISTACRPCICTNSLGHTFNPHSRHAS